MKNLEEEYKKKKTKQFNIEFNINVEKWKTIFRLLKKLRK